MKQILPLVLVSLACAVPVLGVTASPIVVLNERFPGSSARFYAELREAAARQGPVAEVTSAALSSRLDSVAGPGAILVLPDARYFPAQAKPNLDSFLRRGNHVVAVSGPAFGHMLFQGNNGWLTRDSANEDLSKKPGEEMVDFAEQDMAQWIRSAGPKKGDTEFEVVPSGKLGVPDALHVRIGKLDVWDTMLSPKLTKPFPEGMDTTLFWARGGPETPELAIEWREADGSRWMSTIKLTTEWKRYALTPPSFRYWPDSSSKGRGGLDDRFNPSNASVLSIGLAVGISDQPTGKSYEYWISDIRAAADDYAGTDTAPPILESLSPPYKAYRTHVSQIRDAITGASKSVDTDISAPIYRSPGFGSNEARAYRFIPVLEAAAESGELRGAAAHLLLNTTGDYAGSVFGSIGFDQDYLDRHPSEGAEVLVGMLRRIQRGVFLANAGTDRFGYAGGETTACGAYVANLSSQPVSTEIDFTIEADGQKSHSHTTTLDLPARTIQPLRADGGSAVLPARDHTATSVVRIGSEVADKITHHFTVAAFGPVTGKDVVKVEAGDFVLDGTKWYPLGMNYWPTYTSGQERWVPWLEPEQYNPEIVERDLALAERLRMNALSIQYTKETQAPALIDFLARANRRGIKVHCYIPGLHPLSQDFARARSLIQAAHLPESPAFFAYDVGWEVHVGNYARRCQYDGRWTEWVRDNYASLESAEADWHYSPPCNENALAGPTDEQLRNDGEWNTYVAAYRRFWDDEISGRYRAVRSFLRSLDSEHLICARSGYGGTGSMWATQFFPFDLASGAKHLDFTSPEAYALGGDRLGMLKGGLITLYGRFVSGGKPVFWAEYGNSIWPKCDGEALETARRYYEHMLDMTYRSHANGSVGWWWPGGFRLGEDSDFGVVNPDGTPRPAAVEIARIAEKFMTPRQVPSADVEFTMDRDTYAAGFAGVYEALNSRYVEAVEAGKTAALRTSGTGTDSSNTPLVAVGNVPYNGKNPLKYLNAEFNYIRINGQEITDEATIDVSPDEPVYVEASVGNTAEAKWLAPRNATTGAIYLSADSQPEGRALFPITADTPFLADASVPRCKLAKAVPAERTYTFRMVARDRAEFGEVIRVTLKPR